MDSHGPPAKVSRWKIVEGIVKLRSVRRPDGRCDGYQKAADGFLRELGEFARCDDSGSKLFAIKRSAQQTPLGREMLPDPSEAREKILRAFRVAKAAHASLALTCRLVAILCAVLSRVPALTKTCFTFASSGISAFAAEQLRN